MKDEDSQAQWSYAYGIVALLGIPLPGIRALLGSVPNIAALIVTLDIDV